MIPKWRRAVTAGRSGAALAASAGTIGVIIPPSIPFVIYAVVVGESISDLFMAGIVPGILMGGFDYCVRIPHRRRKCKQR